MSRSKWRVSFPKETPRPEAVQAIFATKDAKGNRLEFVGFLTQEDASNIMDIVIKSRVRAGKLQAEDGEVL